MLRPKEVLEPMLPEIAKRGPFGERLLHEGAGGPGQDDLPAVSGVGDAGGPMDVEADVVVSAQDPLPRVEAHPNEHRPAAGPIVRGQATLRRHGGARRRDRICEHREERVPLASDLDPVVLGDGPADDHGVLVPKSGVAITQLLEEPGGTFDVGEQERHRAGGQRWHQDEQCSASAGRTRPPPR